MFSVIDFIDVFSRFFPHFSKVRDFLFLIVSQTLAEIASSYSLLGHSAPPS